MKNSEVLGYFLQENTMKTERFVDVCDALSLVMYAIIYKFVFGLRNIIYLINGCISFL